MDDTPTTLRAPIRSQQDLHDRWTTLMGDLRFSRRSLWMVYVDRERRMFSQISEIVDLGDDPDAAFAAQLFAMCRRLLDDVEPEGSVALLLSRPGPTPMGSSDRAWARVLGAVARRSRVPLETIHFANDDSLRAFAPDDLAA